MRLTTTSFSKPSMPRCARQEHLGHPAFGKLALEQVFAEWTQALPRSVNERLSRDVHRLNRHVK